MTRQLSHQVLLQIAEQTIIHGSVRRERTFRSFFGCSSVVAAALWNRASKRNLLPVGFKPKHLLWTLAFMKLYDSGEVLAAICGCDEKTFRKWVWKGVDVLFDLDLVSPVIVLPFVVVFLLPSFHLSIYVLLTADKMEESIHARQWQCLPCHSRWNGLQDQRTNTLQHNVVFAQDQPCRP